MCGNMPHEKCDERVTMTRNGKIARLPAAIREELNQRLFDGEPAKPLIEWLNGQPRVQAVLKASVVFQ